MTADQTASDMPLFGTMLGQQKHPGHPLWTANADGGATFRVKHLLTTAIIKGYFSKNPSDFKKQYDRAMLKHASAHPVIPQPLAVMQQPNQFYELASSADAGSDLSDSDLDDSIGVEELTLIAATASEQMLDPGHAGGEDYQGGLIEASTENRERLVGASLESLELAQARRAAGLNTTAGIAAEFAADLNVPAGISGKPNSVTHSTLCTYNYEYSFTTCSRCCCRAWGCFTSQRNQKKTRTRYCCHIVTSASCCNGERTVRIFIFFNVDSGPFSMQ